MAGVVERVSFLTALGSVGRGTHQTGNGFSLKASFAKDVAKGSLASRFSFYKYLFNLAKSKLSFSQVWSTKGTSQCLTKIFPLLSSPQLTLPFRTFLALSTEDLLSLPQLQLDTNPILSGLIGFLVTLLTSSLSLSPSFLLLKHRTSFPGRLCSSEAEPTVEENQRGNERSVRRLRRHNQQDNAIQRKGNWKGESFYPVRCRFIGY